MINSYEFGRIVIDKIPYTSDVIIYPDKINSRWWRAESHALFLDDIKEILDYIEKNKIDMVVVGTGHSGMMSVSQEVKDFFDKKNIELFAMKSGDAVEFYNYKCKTKKIIAMFHLTC